MADKSRRGGVPARCYRRHHRQRLSVVVVAFAMVAGVMTSFAPQAGAWSQLFNGNSTGSCSGTCVRWFANDASTAQHGYYLSDRILAHSTWPQKIVAEMTNWNNVSPQYGPKWYRNSSPDQGFVSVDTIDPGLCGLTYSDGTNGGPGFLSGFRMYFNQRQSYADGSGCGFLFTASHEFGHGAFALSHSADSGSQMWYANNGVTNPRADDINGLNSIYH